MKRIIYWAICVSFTYGLSVQYSESKDQRGLSRGTKLVVSAIAMVGWPAILGVVVGDFLGECAGAMEEKNEAR